MKTAFIQSFGCRASQSDGAAIEESLRAAGYTPVRDAASANLVVINTCTVTNAADVDARRTIRSVHRQRPEADILVTGCYAQRDPKALAAIPGVRWVVGNSDKSRIAELIEPAHEEFHSRIVATPFEGLELFAAAPVRDIREDRARPNLKIQDGCGNRCSFCIIPAVRGPSRSADPEAVLAQVRHLATRYCELVLTGINLGRWGRDLAGRPRFPALLRRMLDETDIRRIRLSSVEPMDWTDDLLQLMAGEHRIAPHVHMPLQSGSDTVLKRMYRRYRTRHYAHRIQTAHRMMPHAAFGADVMTGFPAETDAEFGETLQFVEEQPFTYLHVFTYSERPGTVAAQLPGSVPMEVRRERTQALRALGERKNLEFRRSMVGRILPAVTLEEPGIALTHNFLRVRMTQERKPQQMVNLSIGQVQGSALVEQSLLPVLAG